MLCFAILVGLQQDCGVNDALPILQIVYVGKYHYRVGLFIALSIAWVDVS
jgi:hypothetical protein